MTYLFKLYAKNSYVVSYLSVPEEKQHGLYNVKKKRRKHHIFTEIQLSHFRHKGDYPQ